MLNALLKQLENGGVQSVSLLASRLGISEPMLAGMLDNLERMGYIEKLVPGCDNGRCSNCYMKAGCNNNQPFIWKITAKGLNCTLLHERFPAC